MVNVDCVIDNQLRTASMVYWFACLPKLGALPIHGQTKDYKIGACCFSAQHLELKSNNNYWLVRNQNNVSEWTDMYTCRLLS